MATSHFGRGELQAQAAAFLKPNADDKNVGPDELVAFARSVGLQADYRVGGDLERLKLLLANGVPVVAEMWFTPRPNDGMGHYRLLVGYDDVPGRFIAYDSYDQPGVNVPLPYGPFDADWRVFNRTYIPVYTAERPPSWPRSWARTRTTGRCGSAPWGSPSGGGGERERPLRLV